MRYAYKNIVLRDIEERDIDDRIRWFTVETAWGDWDAPDEAFEPIDTAAVRTELSETVRMTAAKPDGEHRWRFEADVDGVHIGWVITYSIDREYRWTNEGVPNTLGIDICESSHWNRGLGRDILAAFIKYHLDSGVSELYLQTWSGNYRMIRVAELLGFAECNRVVGNRVVRGGTYDSLTFRLDEERFRGYMGGSAI